MLHRRFKSELESGVDWSRNPGIPAAKHLAAPVRQRSCPHSRHVFVLGFQASETTSSSRLEDAFQEVYMEDYFTRLTCRRVLCRRNLQMLASPYTLASLKKPYG